MKLLILIGIMASSLAFADSEVKVPLYIHCVQTTGQINRWSAHHLFVFEKEVFSKHGYLINGRYLRAQEHATGTWLVEADRGDAVLLNSEDDHTFGVTGVGYSSESDTSLPKYFVNVGAKIDERPSEVTETSNVDSGLIQEKYSASCEQLSKEEALAKMHLKSL